MEWIKTCATARSSDVENVLAVLLDCGISEAEIVDAADMRRILDANPLHWDYVDETLMQSAGDDAQVVFYTAPTEEGRALLNMAKERLRCLNQAENGQAAVSLRLTSTWVNDADWLNEWKKTYKPFRIGRSVVVVPAWESYTAQSGDTVFTIDPGSVFGTGLHQTTQLALEALEGCMCPDAHVLDVGCGSGILSMVALLKGARSAFLCDIDPAAETAVRDNVRLNPSIAESGRVTLRIGNPLTDRSLRAKIGANHYDIVFANIVADVVIALREHARRWLVPGGRFIASGIIDERADEVRALLAGTGFALLSERERDGWVCMVCTGA